jgi:hypothetical protein
MMNRPSPLREDHFKFLALQRGLKRLQHYTGGLDKDNRVLRNVISQLLGMLQVIFSNTNAFIHRIYLIP